MRVLIVTYNYLTGFGGGVYGARAYINAFAALYDDVTLLFPARSGDEPLPEIDPKVRRIGVVDRASRVRKASRLLLRGILHRFERPFLHLLEQEKFGMIVFQNSKCSSRIIRKARASGARTIVLHDNYEWEYTRDNTPLLQRPLLLPAVVRTEREAVREADLNLALTPDDQRLLTARYGNGMKGRMALLGTFEYRNTAEAVPCCASGAVFAITGNLGVRQTLDSLYPWLAQYLPLLRDAVEGVQVIVAGKNPGPELKKRLQEAGVELVDTPSDMNAVLARAKYYICPVNRGGGVKLRVMDGLRAGLPALVHRVSARGYEALEGISVFVYDDPASFRESLQKMLACSGTPQERQQAYRAQFSFEAGVERLRTILDP